MRCAGSQTTAFSFGNRCSTSCGKRKPISCAICGARRRSRSVARIRSSPASEPFYRLRRVGERGKALVTGGAGFIGSHLSELLLADGWEVYALDDLSTGNLRNVAGLRENPDYHLVVDSVLSPSIVNELVHKCDVVYHLAAAVGVRLIVEQPVHTLVTNV